MHKLFSSLIILFLAINNSFGAIRGEIQRYTILHDKAVIDRDLKARPYHQFLNSDFIISSGLKDLVGDISDGTNDSESTVQKQANMFQLLSKYVNTEQFVDLDISFGIPLFKIKINKYKFYTSAFYHVNFGVMATISNQESVTNPKAQTYVKKDTKSGLNISFKRKDNEAWRIALYQLARSDIYSSITSSALATDGELFSFDNLDEEHKTYSLDIALEKDLSRFSFLAEIRELKALSSSGDETLYGNRPLIHLRTFKKFESDHYHLIGFFGAHYRRWYSLMRGIYAGFDFKYKNMENLRFLFKMSNQFFLLNPMIEFKYFTFTYAYKSPHRNPQDEIWVPGMHNIAIAIPFQ